MAWEVIRSVTACSHSEYHTGRGEAGTAGGAVYSGDSDSSSGPRAAGEEASAAGTYPVMFANLTMTWRKQ